MSDLRAPLMTLSCGTAHGSILLNKTEAFKRVVVHQTVEHVAWPDHDAKDMFHSNKVVNAPEVLPLELLHDLLILLKPGRHDNEQFRMLRHGADLAKPPNSLFSRLITQE